VIGVIAAAAFQTERPGRGIINTATATDSSSTARNAGINRIQFDALHDAALWRALDVFLIARAQIHTMHLECTVKGHEPETQQKQGQKMDVGPHTLGN
jgi:hypothetical protein